VERRNDPALENDPFSDPELPWYETRFFGRLLTILCPPVGLWLLWRHRGLSRTRKIIGTVLTALYAVPYSALAVWLLTVMGMVSLEFRGGFGPSIVRKKTLSNYYLLTNNRQDQKSRTAVPTAPAGESPYWTDFRGPNRDGVYEEQPILTNWPARGPRLLWQQPIGGGYASFVVAEGRAFTIEQRHEEEAVTAYDVQTGLELWACTYPAMFTEWMGGDGPRATPVYRRGLVYSLGALGQLRCLGAATGKVLWEKNVLADTGSANLTYGMAASPLVIGEKLVVLAGHETKGKSVVAYHRLTADRIWSALDDQQAYTTPALVTLAGRAQLLVVSSRRAMGLSADDGKLLWEYPWRVQHGNAIAMPVQVATNRLFLSAGYGAGCVLVEVNGTNDVFTVREVWRNQNLRNKFNSSVFWQGCLYGLDEGVLTCLDTRTGERRWRDGRYNYGQLLLASGHLIILSGDGELALVRASPERRVEIARVQALRGKTWNVPALSQGRLLVRNAADMACFDLRPPRMR